MPRGRVERHYYQPKVIGFYTRRTITRSSHHQIYARLSYVETYTPQEEGSKYCKKKERQGENNLIHLLAKSCCGMQLLGQCVSEKGTQQNIHEGLE